MNMLLCAFVCVFKSKKRKRKEDRDGVMKTSRVLCLLLQKGKKCSTFH
jgi:hypothetical protein